MPSSQPPPRTRRLHLLTADDGSTLPLRTTKRVNRGAGAGPPVSKNAAILWVRKALPEGTKPVQGPWHTHSIRHSFLPVLDVSASLAGSGWRNFNVWSAASFVVPCGVSLGRPRPTGVNAGSASEV